MNKLKAKLEKIYLQYSNLENTSDPLHLIHKLKDKKDIEAFAFLASVFAYGSVKQINKILAEFLNLSDHKPYRFIRAFSNKNSINFKHRFYSEDDIKSFLIILKIILQEYDTLENFFRQFYSAEHPTVKNSISEFSNACLKYYENHYSQPGRAIKFMFPLPEKGSACKRINLFLRWMVRKDNLDFGFWNFIPTSKLIIPVDTHIAKISFRLGLTKRKNVSWKMAEEITENLKKFDKDDPVRFDYSLCHFDMIKEKS
ncbi:TIGR02757 family protein [Ignavibacterium album]|uniref:TIGR02757 family protein n=1 Tax=Ignavibacterium album TaxID=591197 RepID=UPI0026EB5B20|nr:TIGR02757 family protein [Ignavibacterium album]